MFKFLIKYIFPCIFLGITGGCTNELPGWKDPGKQDSISFLVKNPDIISWSGEQILGNTFGGTRNLPMVYSNAGDGDLNNEIWKNYGTESLTNIKDDERTKVLKAIEDKTNGSKISEDLVFPWTAYFLQDVISGQNGNFENAGSNGTPSSSYSLEVWNRGADCRVQSQWYTDDHTNDYLNYELVSNSAHLNNYYQKVKEDGFQERINETTLMTDMSVGTYDEMKGRQFRWYINCHENLHWSEYIIVEVEGSYYICFDFACGHKENDIDGNPGRGCTPNDWDYNDWILKITPAGNQPEVWDGEEDILNPDTPEVNEVNPVSEVEVNLSINDEGNQGFLGLVSKLSLHIRQGGDIEVFIPVPAEYYCKQDDLYIFDRHEGYVEYGNKKVEYTINNQIVSLSINFEENGIRVTTEGVTQEIFDYLVEHNGDGLNFEIYTYFHDIDIENLKYYLDQSTITFLDNIFPDFYINAFTDHGSGDKWEQDCVVSIIPDQEGKYDQGITGDHLNGSSYNEIYTNNDFEGNPGEHNHYFLWGE